MDKLEYHKRKIVLIPHTQADHEKDIYKTPHINELQGSVNSAWVDGDITEEQCDYLYKKYIHGGLI